MKLLPVVVVLSMLILAAASPQPMSSSMKAGSPPVVVELFTSEGCSDCPPADDLLNAMARRAGATPAVIPLAFHVTYWDNQSWRDRFSDMRYTQRQAQYERDFHIPSAYTPQCVVDGRYQVVGNDAGALNAAIRRAAGDPMPVDVHVSLDDDSLKITATASNPAAAGTVLVAITEDDLSTSVKGGENASRTLHHSAVVRSLENAGTLGHGGFASTRRLDLKRGWRHERLHAVVLVQDAAGRILGAATCPIGRDGIGQVPLNRFPRG